MLSQLRTYTTGVLLLLSLGSCKKQYTCSYNYVYMPEHIAFAGYTPGELSKVVVQQYKAGNSFSELISSDTIDASGAVFKGDTAYRSIVPPYYYNGFFYVEGGADYKIKLLNTGRDYSIVLKRGKESETWTQQEHCSPGSSNSWPIPYLTTVDGQDYQASSPYPNTFFIYLRR